MRLSLLTNRWSVAPCQLTPLNVVPLSVLNMGGMLVGWHMAQPELCTQEREHVFQHPRICR